jgi:hypothetical protein
MDFSLLGDHRSRGGRDGMQDSKGIMTGLEDVISNVCNFSDI